MNILKQAQAMQQQMLLVQEGLKEKELTSSVGGGAVTVKVNGQKELLEVKLTDEIVKEAAQDKEMLEDLVLSAVKEAMRQADELAEAEMGNNWWYQYPWTFLIYRKKFKRRCFSSLFLLLYSFYMV